MPTDLQNQLIVFAIVVGLVLFVGTIIAASIMVKPYEIPPFEPDDRDVIVGDPVSLNIKTSNKSSDALIP